MAFELPPLPYPKEALEPHIDAQTMEIHHDKHHGTYVTNLNKALAGRGDLENRPLEWLLGNLDSLPAEIRTAVRNNGGGHSNHSIFWKTLAPKAGGEPTGKIGEEIRSTFGSFDAFKEKMETAGLGRFGSGWSWLALKGSQLEVFSLPNQDSPYMESAVPLFGIDVWEHAYYLKYQNRRADYLKGIWNVVNWTAVGELYAQARTAAGH
ncbi:MAG: superoxide dismutase [Verrucomicrobium sp.]|nr:superoxide dismutase [Verrucomicrobium sp.]